MSISIRVGLVLALCVGSSLAACGNKAGSDEEPMFKLPMGAFNTDGKEAKALDEVKTDWTKIETAGELPSGATKVDPSAISTDGITEPIRGFAAVKATGFRVAYAPTQKYDHFRQAFAQEKVFENVAGMLNQTIKMPRVVDIHLVECGTVNAFYDPNNNRIIMCYELMQYYTEMFKPVSKTNEELGNSIVGATFFAFFHELGHGLRHQLDLAVTGREEDAVDQLATLILMEGGDDGVAAAMAGARWFALQAEQSKQAGHSMPFWDEHSMDGQRFYNIACLIFGSDPEKYAPMVKNGYLPQPRARRCPSEYQQIAKAWDRLLAPHIKEAGETPIAKVPQQVPQPGTGGSTPSAPGTGPLAPKPLPGTGDPAPTPVAEQPAASGATCEQVVMHAVQIASKEMLAQAQQMGPEAVQEVQQQLQANMPLVAQALTQNCMDQNWTPLQRNCLMQAQSIQSLDACGIQ